MKKLLLVIGFISMPVLADIDASIYTQSQQSWISHQVPNFRQYAAEVGTQIAYFTGSQNQVTTITHQFGYNCEYRLNTQTFWVTFAGFCPTSINIQ